MPELPEVETVRRGLQPVMEGARILKVDQRRPDLRFPFPEDFPKRLRGSRVEAVGRRAKYLLFHLDNGLTVISHLGMSGSYRINRPNGDKSPGTFHHQRSKAESHDHLVLHLQDRENAAAEVIFNDPRRFGFMLLAHSGDLEAHPMLAQLGIEPTGNRLDGTVLSSLFQG